MHNIYLYTNMLVHHIDHVYRYNIASRPFLRRLVHRAQHIGRRAALRLSLAAPAQQQQAQQGQHQQRQQGDVDVGLQVDNETALWPPNRLLPLLKEALRATEGLHLKLLTAANQQQARATCIRMISDSIEALKLGQNDQIALG